MIKTGKCRDVRGYVQLHPYCMVTAQVVTLHCDSVPFRRLNNPVTWLAGDLGHWMKKGDAVVNLLYAAENITEDLARPVYHIH